jgi:hypothetical protein
MKRLGIVILLSVLIAPAALSQLLPQGAHVNFCFPQVADGGGQWQTTFVFLNPDTSASASVDLWLSKSDGATLSIDFGSGASAHHVLSIPPRGTRTIRSTSTSPNVRAGWAYAESSIPVQAIGYYSEIVNGIPKGTVAVNPSLPTIQYSSPASRDLGVAIANLYNSSITVTLEIGDSEGVKLAPSVQVSIPPWGQRTFYVFEKFPQVSDFSGTLVISANNTTYPQNDAFVAMTLSQDVRGMWSGLPPGSYLRPQSDFDRIWLVYKNILNTAKNLDILTTYPELSIPTGSDINARAYITDNKIEITKALSQLLDSDSELAAAIGHELGHFWQRAPNANQFDSNSELDADIRGMILALGAGYEPYSTAGALGKLSMLFDRADLRSQVYDNIYDPHTSFANRLDNLHRFVDVLCLFYPGVCTDYKNAFHPGFPPSIPLKEKGTEKQPR